MLEFIADNFIFTVYIPVGTFFFLLFLYLIIREAVKDALRAIKKEENPKKL